MDNRFRNYTMEDIIIDLLHFIDEIETTKEEDEIITQLKARFTELCTQ